VIDGSKTNSGRGHSDSDARKRCLFNGTDSEFLLQQFEPRLQRLKNAGARGTKVLDGCFKDQ
jgi:hypothetical protein